ncbi:NUDIX domain-containing protein [Streptosporangium sp. NPDC002721]|uniref:NUDIX domain-containing protein n=1 Tax=Streptosporangium sp. NPDC002721 TaxID=3366188 RepID=UPI0036C9787C
MSEPYPDPAAWYATLPSVFVSACMLLTDAEDRVLLVKPNYRPGWNFPGGIVEEGEAPHDAATREVAEELGLSVKAGELLVVHWAPPTRERPRAIINFMFDGGVLEDPSLVRLQVEELDEVAFLPWDAAAPLLPAHMAPRLAAGRLARENRSPVYLPGEPLETDG